MKKRYLYTIFVLLAGIHASAQQQPHYTQYMMNPFIINPAVAGMEDYWDLRVSHRHQWAGVQDAPVTSYFTANGPLWKTGREMVAAGHENDRVLPSHPGMGLVLVNDVTGPIRRFAFTANLAHHVRLSARAGLSAGLGVGMQTFSLDGSKLNFANAGDPAAGNGLGVEKRWTPDVRAGLWFNMDRFFAGVSAANIIRQELAFDDNQVITNEKRGRLNPHLFITAGYRFRLNEDFSLLPSLMLRHVSPLPLNVDVNARLQYRNRLWAGVNYRHQDGFAAMLGVQVSPLWNVGYAYDYTTSSLNAVSKGTHELTVGLLLRKMPPGKK